MDIRLLGPLEVRDEDRVVTLPRRQQRALLAALALRAGEVVSTDRLVADLWGERPPASATGSLQNTVSALRKALGRDVVLTQAPGYRLAVDPACVDAHRFERLLAAAREADEPGLLLDEALALWRGPALDDLDEEEFARLAAARLDELRVTAQEERIDAELARGRHASLVGELESLVAQHPLRERLRAQLMLTLYRCGRQAEALEVYRAARLALADELGLDPSPELQELERRVLRQDPSLAAPHVAPQASLPAAAERRLVTVLAAVPTVDDDPERHRRVLDSTLEAVRETLARNGGALERFGPEGLVAVFGMEAPSDDDAHRALAAAQELGLPAGIATGEVVDGAGPVVNRAVELARSEGIALDERTQALVAESRRLDTPLVGRDDELARLTRVLDAGGSDAVTVVGEPGIGKTRLARELASRAEGDRTVLVARCRSYGEGSALSPIVDAISHLDPERALVGEEDAELVTARLGALAPGVDNLSLGESYWAIRRLLEALSPVLLIVDDVHWAEPALLDLMDYLGERLQATALILCLARPELQRPHGEVLRLGPLADEHARAIVSSELEEETRERIVELAEGNALYVEQLSSYAAEGGAGLPPTLEAVLAGRLGRLDDDERTLLQHGAVLGREFSRAALTALSEAPADSALASLSRRGFVHPSAAAEPGDDGYRFHHVLLRDAAYGTLTMADRADLHERAAVWLDRDGSGDDALVGYHLEQAVRYRRELGEDAGELAAKAGERLGEAGMRVWRTNDVTAAANLLERATTLLPDGVRRAELLCEQAIALRLRGLVAEASAALDEAGTEARACGAQAIEARVTAEATETKLLNGELSLDDAVAAFDRALTTLRAEGDLRGLGRAEFLAGSVHWLACNLTAAAASAQRAAQHYTAAGFSAAGCIGTYAEALYYGPTPVDSAIATCSALLEELPDRMTEANVTAVLGGLRALAGNAAAARSLLDHARELYEDLGNSRGLLTVWTPYRIDCECLAGNLDAATALAQESLEALTALGEPGYASTRAVELADLLLLQGEEGEADRLTAIAERDALPSDVLVQFLRRSLRARLLVREGKLSAAIDLAQDAVALASLTDVLRYRARAHLALAEVLVRGGEESAARTEQAAAESLLRQKGVKGALVGAPST